jgi:Tfp pilus assembly protein PilX
MTGNERDRQIAFEAAEGDRTRSAKSSESEPQLAFVSGCVDGLCMPSTTACLSGRP